MISIGKHLSQKVALYRVSLTWEVEGYTVDWRRWEFESGGVASGFDWRKFDGWTIDWGADVFRNIGQAL